MAQATGKRLNDWLRLDSTQEYLQELSIVNNTNTGFPVMAEYQWFKAILIVIKGVNISSILI